MHRIGTGIIFDILTSIRMDDKSLLSPGGIPPKGPILALNQGGI